MRERSAIYVDVAVTGICITGREVWHTRAETLRGGALD
jgi:hypothetical protein